MVVVANLFVHHPELRKVLLTLVTLQFFKTIIEYIYDYS